MVTRQQHGAGPGLVVAGASSVEMLVACSRGRPAAAPAHLTLETWEK